MFPSSNHHLKEQRAVMAKRPAKKSFLFSSTFLLIGAFVLISSSSIAFADETMGFLDTGGSYLLNEDLVEVSLLVYCLYIAIVLY